MINFFIEYLYTLIYVVALSYVISLTYPYIRKENMLRNIMVILSYTFVLNIVTYTSPHNGWLYVIGNLMCISSVSYTHLDVYKRQVYYHGEQESYYY